MNPELKELIDALPKENEGEGRTESTRIPQQWLLEIFAALSCLQVPTGSLHRLWLLSDLSAQIAMAYFSYWVRQWFVGANVRKQRLIETNLRVAVKMVHRLGYLRGAVAKVGQTLGNLPEILPEQVVSTLDKLHCEAPPMHFSLLREMVRNELGKDPEEVFASFERKAFAAASLGQVHRARLKRTGEQVAVKIQYPGIARAIDSDLRNLAAVLFPARLGKDWDSIKAYFEEIRRMLKLEVDYRREAENLRQARALFDEKDGIVVPKVYEAYSTDRILTMQFLPGLHLDAFLATKPPQTLRNSFGTKMYAAWYRMYYASMNYADPHSGNYLFMRDGRLGLLDFGCIQRYNAEEQELVRLAEQFFDGDLSGLPEFMRRARVPEKSIANRDCIKRSEELCRWILEPAQGNGVFDFGDEAHFRRGVEIFGRLVLKRDTQSHPMYLYFNRSVFGLKALLYRLGARIEARAVHDREFSHLNVDPAQAPRA